MSKGQTKRPKSSASSPQEERRYFQDVVRNANTLGPQCADWIRDFGRITRMVAAGDRNVIPIFWIRAYGILADIAEMVDDSLKVMNEQLALLRRGAADLPSTVLAEELGAVTRVRRAIKAIAAAFNDDELAYLQYRRHVECHPLQNAYRLQLKREELRDTVHHRLLGRVMTVDETEAVFIRLLRKYKLNEDNIAIDFAGRALNLIAELEAAAPAWFGRPPPKPTTL